jgi:hypothetical protein
MTWSIEVPTELTVPSPAFSNALYNFPAIACESALTANPKAHTPPGKRADRAPTSSSQLGQGFSAPSAQQFASSLIVEMILLPPSDSNPVRKQQVRGAILWRVRSVPSVIETIRLGVLAGK